MTFKVDNEKCIDILKENLINTPGYNQVSSIVTKKKIKVINAVDTEVVVGDVSVVVEAVTAKALNQRRHE